MGESKNGFVIPDHMDSSLPKKNGKSEKKKSFTKTEACPRAPRDEKNKGKKQQIDRRSEDEKEKQHKLRMKYTKCIYFV